MDPLLVVLLLGLIVVASSVALMALVGYVIRRYPNENDPARNAPRFVRPAGFLLALGAGSLVGLIVAIIVAIFT